MQTSIEWLVSELANHCDMPHKHFKEIIQQAKEIHKQEIMKAYSKQSPIEDGVFTSVNKAEQYYNQTYKQ